MVSLQKILSILEQVSGQVERVAQIANESKEVSYKNKKTAERIEENWDKDRKDFAEFNARMLHLEAEFKSMREVVMNIPQQTKSKLHDVTKPMMKAADSLSESTESLTETMKKNGVHKNGADKKKGWFKF